MRSKAVAIQPLNSLNLRTMMTTKTAYREVAHPTKAQEPSQPLTFVEMFHLEDVPHAVDDFEDLELDHTYFSRLSTLLKPETPSGVALQRNAIYSTISSKGCLNRLTENLARIGYGVQKLSSAAAATANKGSFSSLRHEYLSINLDGKEYIVDPSFKDHFVVQNPTTRYAEVLALVPSTVVVASRQQLLRAVAFLSMELQRCFEARKVSLPPWRRMKSLLSKWEAGTSIRAVSNTNSNNNVVNSSKASSSSSPQSVLENPGFLATESTRAPFPKRFVGFEIAAKGDECFCCGLRIEMLRKSTRQDLKCRVAFSAPAA